MAAHNNSPLPPAPGQRQNNYAAAPAPEQPKSTQRRPRQKSRTFSFRSDKSQRSGGGGGYQVDAHETAAEKDANRLHSKADPTLAMNEAEPSVIQATVKSSLASLRNMDHRDAYGNAIVDPDKSNPTRSRWERPLDTIRSFEAAIDGGYNRKSMHRSETESVANWNRRNSYHSINGNASRFPHDSYYGGRTPRPEMNQYDQRQSIIGQGGMGREGYFDPNQAGYHNGHNNGYGGGHSPAPMNGGRQRYSRMASEPQLNAHRNPDPHVYPIPNNHRSYETVASASGSGSSAEPIGYHTDPTSSDNSSVERMQPPKRLPEQPVNDYGIGFSQTATYQPPAFSVNTNGLEMKQNQAHGQQGNGAGFGQGGPPSVPQKDGRGSILRKPTAQPLATTTNNSQERPAAAEKRKSWFSRRFSRQS